MFKNILTGVASITMLLATVSPVLAIGTPGVVGTWVVADRGPGGWAGGTLLADGTAKGSGGFAYKTFSGEQEVAHISATNWSFANPLHTLIILCSDITGQKGPDFPIGVTINLCFPLEVSGPGAPAPSLFEPDLFTKVMIFK